MFQYPLPITEDREIKEVAYGVMESSWIWTSPRFPETKFYVFSTTHTRAIFAAKN